MSGYRGRFGSLDTSGGPPPAVEVAACHSCDAVLLSDAYLGSRPETFGWVETVGVGWQCPVCVTSGGWATLTVAGDTVSVAWIPLYGGPAETVEAGLPVRWFVIRENRGTGGGVEWWACDGFDSLRLSPRSWLTVSGGRLEVRPAAWLNRALNECQDGE